MTDLITQHEGVKCAECGDDLEAPIPERLTEDCHAGQIVLFVGSGASTESHNVMPHTFYDEIASALGGVSPEVAFPDVMTAFVEKEGRTALLTRFFNRMSYIDSFPRLYDGATRFHRGVAQIPFLREVITTNWDDYFEREADAVPLVAGADFDYWDLPRRKVLKVHGSVLNPGSVIASRSEYIASLTALRSGALGAAAKHLLATHSAVFVGYSLRDDDIRDVIDVLRSDLGTAAKPCYFVHPSADFVSPIEGATVIQTSAAYFVDLLDAALVSAGYLEPVAMYSRLDDLERRLRSARTIADQHLDVHKHPLAIYNLAYQDGLSDALGHAKAGRRRGADRAHGYLLHRAAGYDEARKRANRARNYWDSAYIDGYVSGMIGTAALDLPLRDIPLYYCTGHGPDTSIARVEKAVRDGALTHKAAHSWALRQVQTVPTDMVVFHAPFLPAY